MNLKLSCAVLAAICFAMPAQAESAVSNVVSTLAASPTSYSGACPGVITFNGAITVEGRIDPSSPVEMAYTFLRSDGATGPINYFTMTAPGTRNVQTTWTLGGPGLPSFAGWQQLKAWPTRHLGFGYSFSPKAEFRLACAHATAATPPRLDIGATLYAVPRAYTGTCPGVITFKGEIIVAGAVTAPMQIGYTFLRSDGATGPVRYITVDAPGNYPVEDSWTLGGPGLPAYSGWQQLKVWPTRHEGGIGTITSPRADFRLMCR